MCFFRQSQAETLEMNLTANMDVSGDGLFENLQPVEETMRSNMSIYYSIKSNNSDLADCSQTILMDEIKVRVESFHYFRKCTFFFSNLF